MLAARRHCIVMRRRRSLTSTSAFAGIDVLNRSMLSDALPIDMLRGLGFFAMSALGPLRRAALREGVLPHRRRSLRSAPRPEPGAIF